MQSEQLQSAQTVTIYKAPQKGKGQKLLKEGFQAVDFPYNPPDVDGSCYFANPNDRSIAEEFNQSYQEGVLEVVIDQTSYDRYFKQLEFRYDEKDNCERIEVVVPQNLFPIFTSPQTKVSVVKLSYSILKIRIMQQIRIKGTKVPRVASLSGPKPLSFPYPAPIL